MKVLWQRDMPVMQRMRKYKKILLLWDILGLLCHNGATGTLTTQLENHWTATINAQDITKSVGAAVTQSNGYMTWTIPITTPEGITENVGVATSIVHTMI